MGGSLAAVEVSVMLMERLQYDHPLIYKIRVDRGTSRTRTARDPAMDSGVTVGGKLHVIDLT